MELYTLDAANGFEEDILIDAYESLIWTERFIEPGDCRLALPAHRDFLKMTRPGTLLGLSTSREPMRIESREIEDGLLVATGKTLEQFFNQRRHGRLVRFTYPGVIMGDVVENMQTWRSGIFAIPGVRLGPLDATPGTSTYEVVNAGWVHETLLMLAKKYMVGMSVYRTPTSSGVGFDLAFSTRRGVDLTKDPDSPVIFSPDLDNLANIKELLSDAESKNVAWAYPPTGLTLAEGMVPIEETLYGETYSGFDLRLVEVNMNFITKPSQLDGATNAEKQDSLYKMMQDRAKAALIPMKKVIDGELTSESQFKYYTERNDEGLPTFRLGDQVGVVGNFTDPVKGILSEYIQSADGNGSRSYPSFATLANFVREHQPPPDGGAA